MTGGQASATSILGQITTTTKKGRDPKKNGYPVKIAEMVALCDGAVYVERTGIFNPQSIIKTKAAIKNESVTPGPASLAATVPGKMKIPVPITAPIPMVNKSKAPSVLTKCLSVPR